MQDRIQEIIDQASRKQGIAAPQVPTLRLISFRSLSAADVAVIQRFQGEVGGYFKLDLIAVGGGHGCTKIDFAIVVDSRSKARRLLSFIAESEFFHTAARAAGFRVLITREPYTRRDLASGESQGPPPQAVRLFTSYSHDDEVHREELSKHLALLRRQGLVYSWDDRQIDAGDEWRREIDRNLENADIVCLLVSANFLASDYCFEIEMRAALRRHEDGKCRVIPVLVSDADWESAPFAKLQVVPSGVPRPVPVESWQRRNEAWANVARHIRKQVNKLLQQDQQRHQPEA